MQIKYGTYAFEANGVSWRSRKEMLLNVAEVPYGYKLYATLEGWLTGTTDELCTKELALRAALEVPYQDLIFYKDDSTETPLVLRQSDSLSGIIVKMGPDFDSTRKSEYATTRQFSIQIYGEFSLPNQAKSLIAFSERVETSGGGPFYIHKRAVEGPPQKQMVWEQMEQTGSQDGEAIGYLDYPEPAKQIWPDDLKEPERIIRTTPQRIGSKHKLYKIEWHYKFEGSGVGLLAGRPTLWTDQV